MIDQCFPNAMIEEVDSASAAARAGLRPGMCILSVDGEPLRDILDWLWLTDGDQVELEVLSGQDECTAASNEEPISAQISHCGPVPQSFPPCSGVRDCGSGAAMTEWHTDRHLPRPTTTCQMKRNLGEGWGVSFGTPVFDGVRRCVNHCSFCFIDMLPKGLRKSLYLRDDDYRLSFMQGNFVTLTNLEDADVSRIIEQFLSPLHVSLHAVRPEVRRNLMGQNAERGMEVLETLMAAGIEVHTQIVLLPGVNDGEVLNETLAWALVHPEVLSVGIVPYAYTRYAQQQSSFTAGQAAKLIDGLGRCRSIMPESCHCRPGQQSLALLTGGDTGYSTSQSGVTALTDTALELAPRVQLADEWFLLADRPVPEAVYYGDYPQYDNGIGMIRSFSDEWQEACHCGPDPQSFAQLEKAETNHTASQPGTTTSVGISPAIIVTGTAFAPVLEALLAVCPWAAALRVLPIENRFFGSSVNVAGLITGADLIQQLAALSSSLSSTPVLLPAAMFNNDSLTLDNFSVSDLRQQSEQPLYVVPCTARGLLDALYKQQMGRERE
ncbi:MAG: DUF512 domain-containing protein [Actinomycetia bacterium]|nr:DUF512 domain-containing protein [Actinomycetes bacterium]